MDLPDSYIVGDNGRCTISALYHCSFSEDHWLRRPWISFSGLFSALAFLALAGSGVYIAIEVNLKRSVGFFGHIFGWLQLF